MQFIIDNWETILAWGATTLPIIGLLIPRIFSEKRVAKMLAGIDKSSYLNYSTINDIRLSLSSVTNSVKLLSDKEESFTKIAEEFSVIKNEFPIINEVKTELKNSVKTLESIIDEVAKLAQAVTAVSEVTAEFAKQSKEVQELKELVKKLSNRLGA